MRNSTVIILTIWFLSLPLVAFWGFVNGRDYGKSECAAALETAKLTEKVQVEEDKKVVVDLTTVQKERQIVYKTIVKEVEKVVERPVYRECRMDADGLGLWNSANDGVLYASPGGPAPGVPLAPPPR